MRNRQNGQRTIRLTKLRALQAATTCSSGGSSSRTSVEQDLDVPLLATTRGTRPRHRGRRLPAAPEGLVADPCRPRPSTRIMSTTTSSSCTSSPTSSPSPVPERGGSDHGGKRPQRIVTTTGNQGVQQRSERRHARRVLERAIRSQMRVIGIVARSSPTIDSPSPRSPSRSGAPRRRCIGRSEMGGERSSRRGGDCCSPTRKA